MSDRFSAWGFSQVVRWILTGSGVGLLVAPVLSDAQVEAIIGMFATLSGVLWSVLCRYLARRRLLLSRSKE